ncbi:MULTISPECIES: helix-turn-helix domain-containing protein [unclassified Streptomyces]|uniref:helix-turn-helix domain-containing protein n=1 Tax=unclassified Streptomyces TaxID=2593676 RepID=UPI00332A849B
MPTLVPDDEVPTAWTVAEVVIHLRLSRSKIYDLIRSRRLASFTEGRSRRIPVTAVRQYMNDRLEEAA